MPWVTTPAMPVTTGNVRPNDAKGGTGAQAATLLLRLQQEAMGPGAPVVAVRVPRGRVRARRQGGCLGHQKLLARRRQSAATLTGAAEHVERSRGMVGG